VAEGGGDRTLTFFVPPDSPHRTLADFVAYARANPERVTYGTTGIGSDDHLAALAFERLASVRLTHVPFAGAAQVSIGAETGPRIEVGPWCRTGSSG
jgi:tripartite-type tricarboxylate transporter receptor subunit TctC